MSSRPYLKLRGELARMTASRRRVGEELAAIEATIEHQADRDAQAEAIELVGGMTYCFGRGSTTWRPTHERIYRRELERRIAVAHYRREAELEALRRKLLRQTSALEAFVRRHGFNDLEEVRP